MLKDVRRILLLSETGIATILIASEFKENASELGTEEFLRIKRTIATLLFYDSTKGVAGFGDLSSAIASFTAFALAVGVYLKC